MNNTLTLIIAAFDLLSSPFTNGNGEARPKNLASPPVPYANCGEPLIQIKFSKGYQLLCDNWHCWLFRQPQGYRLTETSDKAKGVFFSASGKECPNKEER